MKNLKEQVKLNLDFVKKSYENQNGFSTMFVVGTKNKGVDETTAVLIKGEEIMKKRWDTLFDLGIRFGIQLMKKEVEDVNAIFMMSEGWMSTQDNVKDGYKKPSEDPNRIECIISSGLSKDGQCEIEVFEIKKRWVGDDIKVEFESIKDNKVIKDEAKETKEEDVKIGSPLLEQFWGGMKMMESFRKSLPKDMEKYLQEETTEKLFEIFIRNINLMRNKINE